MKMTAPKNPSAVALGKLARGHAKTITPEDRLARAERCRAAQAKRVVALRAAKGGK